MNDLLFRIIDMLLKVASPEIIKAIQLAVDDMVKQAMKTSNPFDDVFAGLLQALVGKPSRDPNT